MTSPAESLSFLAEASALHDLSAEDHQFLLNYLSSRLRACGIAWNDRYNSLSRGKRRAFINQFSDDLHMAMMLYSASALRFNHHIHRPTALANLAKVALSTYLDKPLLVADAVTVKRQDVLDPVLPRYVDDWWNQDVPKTLGVPQLVAAWRAQKEEFGAAVKTSPVAMLQELNVSASCKVDQSLQEAASAAEKSLSLIDTDLELARQNMRYIQSTIEETEKIYEKLASSHTLRQE